MKPIVPDNFVVPTTLKTESFKLRPLGIRDVEKDYEAVMSSVEHLQAHISPEVFGHVWPSPTMTKDDDLADLGWHQVEFQMRSSFTYTVLSLDEQLCLGCVYILPPRFTDAEAEVFLWVRKSAYDEGLDTVLFQAIKTWLKSTWPFQKVAFPGRE